MEQQQIQNPQYQNKYGEEFSFQQLFEDENEKCMEEKKEVKIESRHQKMMKDMHISSDSENENVEMKTKKIRIEKPDRTKRCSGCYPIFQMNQEGHMGMNGCLSDRM